jgi:hypothetical protein
MAINQLPEGVRWRLPRARAPCQPIEGRHGVETYVSALLFHEQEFPILAEHHYNRHISIYQLRSLPQPESFAIHRSQP